MDRTVVALETYYSSSDVCREIGITYRMLDYWCRSGLIPGQERHPGSGCPRTFDPDQVARVRRIKEIKDEIGKLEAEIDAMRLDDSIALSYSNRMERSQRDRQARRPRALEEYTRAFGNA